MNFGRISKNSFREVIFHHVFRMNMKDLLLANNSGISLFKKTEPI